MGIKIPKYQSILFEIVEEPESVSVYLHLLPTATVNIFPPVCLCEAALSAWKALYRLLCLLRLHPRSCFASSSALLVSLAGTLVRLSLHCVTVSCLLFPQEYELLRAGTRSISIFLFVVLVSNTVPIHTAGTW